MFSVDTARQLLSQDFSSNTVKYKYCYAVDILPICKDDLCILPTKLCSITVIPKIGCNLQGMDPLCLCYKVTNLIFFINPFTGQRAEINVEKYNNAPFRSVLTTKSLVEYTVLDVSYNPARYTTDVTNKKRLFVMEEVTVCRSDRLGQPDANITTMTHLGALLNEGDTVLGYDLSCAVLNDDDVKPMKDRSLPDVVLVRKSFPKYREMNVQRNWKLQKLDVNETESNRKNTQKKDQDDYEHFLKDIEEDAEMRSQINIYKNKNAKQMVLSGDIEEDAPIIPLEEMLEELNLDEEVQGDDMVLEGSSEEDN